MAWPKGVPRKGYVKGSIESDKDVMLSFKRIPRSVEGLKVEVIRLATAPEPLPEPALHGMTGTAITEPCPLCLYAYADGGYCPECGWSKPIRIDEYGTHSGGRL